MVFTTTSDILYLIDKDFEIIDHTADVGIIAYGADIRQAFANAAKALFSIITEPEDIQEVLYRDIKISATDQESLLVQWLNELIYLFDTENILFKRFDIAHLSHTRLKVRIYGENVDKSKHELKTGVKATSYHMLKIDENDGCKVQVLFDI